MIFFFPFNQTNECIYSQRKREKIYINTAAIFVRKFYIRKFLVFLVLFWKKELKLLQILLQRALQIDMVIWLLSLKQNYEMNVLNYFFVINDMLICKSYIVIFFFISLALLKKNLW